MGSCSILNVVGGDVKVTFDKDNPAETIRAARIVKDLLRRGYALLVEVERDGEKKFERALDFNEQTAEYIIADYDPQTVLHETQRPVGPALKPQQQERDEEDGESSAPEESGADSTEEAPQKKGRGRPRKAIPAATTRSYAVARSAGG